MSWNFASFSFRKNVSGIQTWKKSGKVEMMRKRFRSPQRRCIQLEMFEYYVYDLDLTLLLSVRVKYLIFPLRLLKANLGCGCCYCYEVMGIISMMDQLQER